MHDQPTDELQITEAAIRSDERHRLAALLHDHAETIAAFAKDGESAVRIVALMLELDRP